MKKKVFLKTVFLRRVLYPTGSMQQLLNGRAALSHLYTEGNGICFCAPRRGKEKKEVFTTTILYCCLTHNNLYSASGISRRFMVLCLIWRDGTVSFPSDLSSESFGMNECTQECYYACRGMSTSNVCLLKLRALMQCNIPYIIYISRDLNAYWTEYIQTVCI